MAELPLGFPAQLVALQLHAIVAGGGPLLALGEEHKLMAALIGEMPAQVAELGGVVGVNEQDAHAEPQAATAMLL